METPDLYELFVRPVHGAGLRYMVSGSLASVHFGEPRLTLDVDIVIHLQGGETAALLGAFAGPDFYTPPPEVVAIEVARPTRGHFNVIHLPTGQKADFYPSRAHPYWGWAWEHRRTARAGAQEVQFAPPEYVILWKLEFFREGGGDKHVRDIRGMLLVNGETIDREMLDRACFELGLAGIWQRILADV